MKNSPAMMLSITKVLFVSFWILACQGNSDTAIVEDIVSTPAEVVDNGKLDYIMGKFNPESHEDFVKIEAKYASREGMYLRREAYESFIKMTGAASKAGIEFTIRSAARNFDYQKGIWERKWKGETILSDGSKASDITSPKDRSLKILLYSSMPGSSRHHWGTDIDLNSFSNNYFSQGQGLKEYTWLIEHAHEYGFCQPYIDKSNGRTGYEEEKWHWSYMPISQGLTEYSERHLRDDMIQGFQGAKTAKDVEVVKNYVLGINPSCR